LGLGWQLVQQIETDSDSITLSPTR